MPRHLLGLLCLLIGRIAFAQHETSSDIFSGEQAFQSFCASCHGKAGNQIANVDLGHGVFRKPYDDRQLTDIAMKGIAGTAMPATPGLSIEQAAQIVVYLRSRSVAKDAASGGDASRGRALFSGKGQCMSCHRINSEGARQGPELSRIGLLRTSDQLATSLLEPDREVQPANRWYALTTKAGHRVSGRLLNHDAFTVQMLDGNDELRSFMKGDLLEMGFIPSPMPSARSLLDDQEIADVVRYLVSLRGDANR